MADDSELVPIFNLRPRAKPTPGPLGSDIGGVRATTSSLSIVTGRNALAHAILRRLTTPRGGLFYDPEYGYDVLNAIGATLNGTVGQIEQGVLEQITAEEEVETASVRVTFLAGVLRVVMRVVDGDGPFDLTMTVDQLTIAALVDGTTLLEELR